MDEDAARVEAECVWHRFPDWLWVSDRASAVLAVVEPDWVTPARLRLFDAASFAALGPEIRIGGHACLADLPDRTVAVEATVSRLRTWDPFAGEALADVPYDSGLEEVLSVAAAVVDGRGVAFVFGWESHRYRRWQALDLGTGERLYGSAPEYSDCMLSVKMRIVSDFLVVPGQTVRFDHDDVLQENRLDVVRARDGAVLGAVRDADPEEFGAAVAGGRPLVAVHRDVHELPGRAAAGRLPRPWKAVSLSEPGGRAVVAAVRRGPDGCRLGTWPIEESPEPSARFQGPWGGSVYDFAVTAAGTAFVASKSGLWAFVLPGG